MTKMIQRTNGFGSREIRAMKVGRSRGYMPSVGIERVAQLFVAGLLCLWYAAEEMAWRAPRPESCAAYGQ